MEKIKRIIHSIDNFCDKHSILVNVIWYLLVYLVACQVVWSLTYSEESIVFYATSSIDKKYLAGGGFVMGVIYMSFIIFVNWMQNREYQKYKENKKPE